jgi:hypothetical protein
MHREELVEQLATIFVQLLAARPEVLAQQHHPVSGIQATLQLTHPEDEGALELAIDNRVALDEERSLHLGAEVVLDSHRLQSFR